MTTNAQGYTPIMLRSDALVVVGKDAQGLGDWSVTSVQSGGRALALDEDILKRTHDFVWWRRVYYVLMVFACGMVALSPWLIEPVLEFDYVGRFHPAMRSVVAALGLLLPGWSAPWLEFLESHPVEFALLVAIAYFFYRKNGRLSQCISEHANLAWSKPRRDDLTKQLDGGAARFRSDKVCGATLRQAQVAKEKRLRNVMPSSMVSSDGVPIMVQTDAASPVPQQGWVSRRNVVRWFRTNAHLKGVGHFMDRWLLPWIVILVFLFVAFVTMSRVLVTWNAPGLCKPSAELAAPGFEGVTRTGFNASDPCWASGVSLTQGERYRVSMTFDRGVFDGGLMATATGFGSSVFKLPAAPFARWWRARWLQPIGRIANAEGEGRDAPLNELHHEDIPPRVVHSWRAARVPGTGIWEIFTGFRCAPVVSEGLARAEQDWQGVAKKGQLKLSFTSEFTADYSGELFLYLNDAMLRLPFFGWISCAYDNNVGAARVVVKRLPDDG